MKNLLLFFSLPFYGQVLHHQMLSSQCATKEITNKVIVSQTIGQQSITGNSNNGMLVIQGFQQSLWGELLSQNGKSIITAKTFPNPFIEVVNFQFSENVSGELSIYIFDVTGKLVHKQDDKIDNSILTINLSKITSGEYLVQLNNKSFTYYTKIIKL